MHKLPQTESISHMKHRYNEVIAQLEHSPVVLTQSSRAVADLVAPEEWNAAVDEQRDLKDIIAGLRAELAHARGEDTAEVIDPATFLREIVGAGSA